MDHHHHYQAVEVPSTLGPFLLWEDQITAIPFLGSHQIKVWLCPIAAAFGFGDLDLRWGTRFMGALTG